MLNQRHKLSNRRRGMILLVVLSMLTLFTIIGITFVYLSDSVALGARISKDAENIFIPDMDPQLALSYVLGQLIYDVNDDNNGILSALRGNSLARNMYGWNYDNSAAPKYLRNDAPYNGLGKMVYQDPVLNVSNANLINYQYFAVDKFLRDPERLGHRANGKAQRQSYVAGAVPYTYPDNNNVFLAVINPTNGQVIQPSFHRSWLWNNQPLNNTGNAHWTDQVGKYLTLRPRRNPPLENPNFALPTDAGGDVKNLDGAPGGNDSIWIDVNAPIMTAPNGQQYKMLVAPLIIELDGRINLNVHGNIRGTNNTHVGNMGFGPSEVNLGPVFAFGTAAEWPNLFVGSSPNGVPRVQGRYGLTRLPILPAGGAVTFGPTLPRPWAPIDLNGVVDPPGAANATGLYTLPTAAGPSPFATFPSNAYWNGAHREVYSTANAGNLDHPLAYDPLSPASGNRLLPLADMAALLRHGGTNSEFLSSDLMRLCPNSFNPSTNTNFAQFRNLITNVGFDLDRPGLVPYLWDRSAKTGNPYVLTGAWPYSVSQVPITTPFAATNTLAKLQAYRAATPASSEFDPNTWRSTLSQLVKLNLNRTLTDYHTLVTRTAAGTTTITPYTPAQVMTFNQAQTDRQNLAKDIFNYLQQATGARNPATDPALMPSNYTAAGQWNALRYLAQLAVNIVDFIDADDYITPFQWMPTNIVLTGKTTNKSNTITGLTSTSNVAPGMLITGAGIPGETIVTAIASATSITISQNAIATHAKDTLTFSELVYGVESPRLVINELYSQFDNYQAGLKTVTTTVAGKKVTTTTATGYRSNFWVELHNPFPATFPGFTDNATYSNDTVAYLDQVTVPGGVVTPVYQLLLVDNTANGVQSTVLQLAGNTLGAPSGTPVLVTAFGNQSIAQNQFKILEPPTTANTYYMAAENPQIAIAAANAITTAEMSIQTANTAATPDKYTVLLQRLLCPAMPLQANPTLPNYNPYITVDYVDNITPNDTREYNPTQILPATNVKKPSKFASTGRKQIWSANTLVSQTSPNANANGARNTFGKTNTPAQSFDWLVQLDRQLVSKAELLSTPYCKPHELTQLFVQTVGGKQLTQQHLAPWTDQTTRLYRFLEMADVAPRMSGLVMGGRIPGRINVNTVPDNSILHGVADPETANYYTKNAANLNQFLNGMITTRTPAFPTPGQNDVPYWPLGVGPGGPDLVSQTARDPDNQLNPSAMFAAAAVPTSPYEKNEILNKLTNNLTTRSNVFAVWLTVGFFAVNNGQLGAEIGITEGRTVRHRMFAIVDRTNLQVFSTTSKVAITGSASGQSNPVSLAQMSGTIANSATNLPWAVQTGSILVYDPNTLNEETVVVQAGATPNTFSATFYKNHTINSPVICRGNPGPWQIYDPRQDTAVVPYFAMIK